MAAIAPITTAIRPAKQRARRHYGSHPYFTKRAWNVVQAYIQRFTRPGDTVLDPFGGSGVTAVESLVLRRRAVYVDISRWACFLARQTAIAPVDLRRLQEAFGQVEDAARATIEEIWNASARQLTQREVADWYPRGVPLPSNADVRHVEELFTPRMLHGLARLRAAIGAIADAASRDLLLLAFSATLARINRTFLSATDRAESRGGSAVFSIYRYKVAKSVVELPLWEQFARRVQRLIEAKRETNRLIGEFYREPQTAQFHHASATRLLDFIAPESVDYIYTDPPYGGHIAYLDLSTMWGAWLGMEPSARDRAEEVIEGGELRKSRDVYRHLLARSLEQMATVLKPRRWMSLVFAHRDTTYWEMLVDACGEAGFEYVNTVVQPVGVVWSMHKKKNPLRVLSGELVLNFRRSRHCPAPRAAPTTGDPLLIVRTECERAIVEGHGSTTEDLHHRVVPALLEAGLLAGFSRQFGDLTPVLTKYFRFDRASGRWHLRDGIPLAATIQPAALVAYHVIRLLGAQDSEQRSWTEAQIRRAVAERIAAAACVTPEAVRDVLTRVACSPDGRQWRLRGRNGQIEFAFPG